MTWGVMTDLQQHWALSLKSGPGQRRLRAAFLPGLLSSSHLQGLLFFTQPTSLPFAMAGGMLPPPHMHNQ
jgi:hypothetical protein